MGLIALLILLAGLNVFLAWKLYRKAPVATVMVVDETPTTSAPETPITAADQTFLLEDALGNVRHEIHSHTLGEAPEKFTYHEVTYYLTGSDGPVFHYQVPPNA